MRENRNPRLLSLTDILLTDWRFCFAGAILIYIIILAYLPSSGNLFIPDLSAPYSYEGDSIFHLWMINRVAEGWVFEGVRSGYPFGSSFLDYPGSDAGSHLILKFLASIAQGAHSVYNLFYIIGFFVTYFFAFLVLRAMGLGIFLSFAGAAVFDILPFHFLRISHLFYTWYFVVPLYFYYGLLSISAKEDVTWRRYSYVFISLLILSSFGVYYSLFGVLTIMIFGVWGAIRESNIKILLSPIVFSSVISLGVLINIAPNLQYAHTEGVNIEVAKRSPVESEIYGFKFVQLVLPMPLHRVSYLSGITNEYNSKYPLINENMTASLGLIGSLGFLLSMAVVLIKLADRKIDEKIVALSLAVLVLFLFGTIGGLGVVFAQLISPSIRGWNRISIFIGFGVVSALLFFIDGLIAKRRKYFESIPLKIGVTGLFVGLALFDQMPHFDMVAFEKSKGLFKSDQKFVQAIELSLPKGAAIYQLPYIGFPETSPIGEMGPYTPLTGYIHSKSLRWSSGGMKGRSGDLFFRELSQNPLVRQIDVIVKLGFSGVYIDTRGYKDHGSNIIKELTLLLGYGPTLVRSDGQIVFFKLDSLPGEKIESMTFEQISGSVNNNFAH